MSANVALAADKVKVSITPTNFPTYEMGPDDPCAYLKDFRVQGLRYFRDKRPVYPYTFKNDYLPTKKDVSYDVVRLENDYIYVDIIPELRGRVQGAVDKSNGWEFIYYNHAIKPAEVSVRSAWLAGGLEFNHPGGHGYTQLDKISYKIVKGDDGSQTVIITEIEPARMMKWQYEITLRPNDLALETKGRFISIVPYTSPFVSSNNAAMHVTKEMELIYPQKTYATGHANGNLKRWDRYSDDGSNWSWPEDTKVALSIFTDGHNGLTEDYWGVYSHDKGIEAGSVVVGDHRQTPGKKYFTWGTSDSGRQWDTFLSDTDGGYVEVQHQAFNSKMDYDYGVIEPFEVKEFSIYWYPIKDMGGFVKASRELTLNYKRLDDSQVKIDMTTSLNIPNAKVQITKNGELIDEMAANFKIGDNITKNLDVETTTRDIIGVKVFTADNRIIMDYLSDVESEKPVINEIQSGKEINEYSINELYTLAMSNYHDPYGVDADVYVKEMLARDPYESRALRMKGTTEVRRGQWEQAIASLEKSLVDGYQAGSAQARFLLGYANLRINNLEKAHEWLCQSSRHREFLDASLFYLAQIEVIQGNYHMARMRLNEVPFSRLTHPDIYSLLAYVNQKLGDKAAAQKALATGFERDPMNFVSYVEDLVVNGETKAKIDNINNLFDRESEQFMGSMVYFETAVFYMNIKDYEMALKVMNIAEDHFGNKCYPFIYYYKGYALMQLGKKAEALDYYAKASAAKTTYVFPYRKTSIDVLADVIANNPKDDIALMYMGDLTYYLHRHDDAINAWEKSYAINANNTRVNRNLAIARHVEKYDSLGQTVALLEEAFAASDQSMRTFTELEALYLLTRDNKGLAKLYDNNLDLIHRKGAYALNVADFYNRVGRPQDAKAVMLESFFSAEEKLLGTPYRHVRYENAAIGCGVELLEAGKYNEAVAAFKEAYLYPENINEAKVNIPVTAPADYYTGLALSKSGKSSEAKSYFEKAVNGRMNDNSVATIYKAKALVELGKQAEAEDLINGVVSTLSKGEPSATDCYILSLAYGFLGDNYLATEYMAEADAMDVNVIYNATYASAFMRARKYSIE